MRQKWLQKLTLPPDFALLTLYKKLDIVLNHAKNVKFTAQYLIDIINLRSEIILTIT